MLDQKLNYTETVLLSASYTPASVTNPTGTFAVRSTGPTGATTAAPQGTQNRNVIGGGCIFLLNVPGGGSAATLNSIDIQCLDPVSTNWFKLGSFAALAIDMTAAAQLSFCAKPTVTSPANWKAFLQLSVPRDYRLQFNFADATAVTLSCSVAYTDAA